MASCVDQERALPAWGNPHYREWDPAVIRPAWGTPHYGSPPHVPPFFSDHHQWVGLSGQRMLQTAPFHTVTDCRQHQGHACHNPKHPNQPGACPVVHDMCRRAACTLLPPCAGEQPQGLPGPACIAVHSSEQMPSARLRFPLL